MLNRLTMAFTGPGSANNEAISLHQPQEESALLVGRDAIECCPDLNGYCSSDSGRCSSKSDASKTDSWIDLGRDSGKEEETAETTDTPSLSESEDAEYLVVAMQDCSVCSEPEEAVDNEKTILGDQDGALEVSESDNEFEFMEIEEAGIEGGPQSGSASHSEATRRRIGSSHEDEEAKEPLRHTESNASEQGCWDVPDLLESGRAGGDPGWLRSNTQRLRLRRTLTEYIHHCYVWQGKAFPGKSLLVPLLPNGELDIDIEKLRVYATKDNEYAELENEPFELRFNMLDVALTYWEAGGRPGWKEYPGILAFLLSCQTVSGVGFNGQKLSGPPSMDLFFWFNTPCPTLYVVAPARDAPGYTNLELENLKVFDSLSQAIVVPKGQYEAAMSQTLFTEALSSWKSGKRPSWYSCTFSAAFTSQSSEEPKAAQEVPEWAARCIHKNNVKEDTTMDWTPSWTQPSSSETEVLWWTWKSEDFPDFQLQCFSTMADDLDIDSMRVYNLCDRRVVEDKVLEGELRTCMLGVALEDWTKPNRPRWSSRMDTRSTKYPYLPSHL